VALTTRPLLAPRSKKEYSYTSIPPLGLHVLFHDKCHLFTFMKSLDRHNNELCTLYDDPDVVTGIKTGRLKVAGTPL
jgi:hypothetical protein